MCAMELVSHMLYIANLWLHSSTIPGPRTLRYAALLVVIMLGWLLYFSKYVCRVS